MIFDGKYANFHVYSLNFCQQVDFLPEGGADLCKIFTSGWITMAIITDRKHGTSSNISKQVKMVECS